MPPTTKKSAPPSDGAPEAPGIQAQLGAAGACPVVRWRGKPYKVGHPTQEAKARLEELAAQAAVARVEALEGKVGAAAFARMTDRVCDRVAANEYVTWAAGWQEVVWRDGGALFLLSLLHEHHPELTPADAAAMKAECAAQYGAALARVLPGFFELLLGELEAPPERKARARAELGAALAKFTATHTPPPPPTPGATSD